MIDIDDLFVLYRGVDHDVVALRGLSLRVAAGERVVVNGPSGSGKSTLIKVVIAEVMPGAGRAVVLGRDIGQLGPSAARVLRRERIGIITQGSGRDLAPELTCVQNVALQARLAGVQTAAAETAAVETMGHFAVAHLAQRYPATLSGGEAQRVGVAAALASHPGVIVADEPTGELDRVNAEMVYDLLSAHAQASGAGLLVVTHDVQANRIADRVITIRDGRVSSELSEAGSRLIVDPRGWVRLPDADRHRARIIDRAIVTSQTEGVLLTGLLPREPGIASASSFPAPVGAPAIDTPPVNGPNLSPSPLPSPLPLPLPSPSPSPLPSPSPSELPSSPSPSPSQRDASPPAPILTVVDASFAVGSTVILSPVSFVVSPGSLTVLAGPSGSGKTTLLGLLGGLGHPTTGTISFQDPKPAVSIGSSLAGFAEQSSVRENLLLVRSLRRLAAIDVIWALRDLGIEHLAARPVATLSGGERQRVGVARALVTDSELVLLDEPTSQLDESAAALLASMLKRLTSEGRTIVCTSHDAAIINQADEVIALGRLS